MLFILITALLLIPVIAGIGALVQTVLPKITDGFSGKVLTGILPLGIVWLIIAFLFPLNLYVEVITLIIGFSSFLYYKVYQDLLVFTKKEKWLLTTAIMITAFFGSFHPYILDHFGYYVPTVQWLSEVGLVKGLSNLDLILGQMSFWHILQAGFSNFSDALLRLNSILLILYLIYIFEKKSWIHLVFLPVLILFAQQPSPDLPVIVFSLILVDEILRGNRNSTALLFFSAFVFALKPTAVWLPLAVFLYSVLVLKPKFIAYIPAFLVLILFCIKNLWTFGYPVFPVQMFDIGLNWKPNPEILETSSKLAVQKTYNLQYTYDEIQRFSVREHVVNWLFIKGIKGKIHVLFVLLLIAFSVFAFVKKNRVVSIICFSLIAKSALVLMFSAQYRFFLDVFFIAGFVMLYHVFSMRKSLLIFTVFTVFVGALLSFPKILQHISPSFKLGFAMRGFQWKQIWKPGVYTYEKYKTYRIGNLKFNAVYDYPFSFDTPLPAISPSFILEYYRAGIFPQLVGNSLKEGFIWKKLSSEEMLQVKQILTDLKIDADQPLPK